MGEPTREDWLRLARLLENRRNSMPDGPIAQRAIVPHTMTWKELMDGQPKTERTLRRIEHVLGLAVGACNEVLAGATALRLRETAASQEAEPDPRRVYEEAGRVLMGLAGATPQERAEVERILERARRRALGGNDNADT